MGKSSIHLTVLVSAVTLYGVLGMMGNLVYAASASEHIKRAPAVMAITKPSATLITKKRPISGPRTGMASKSKKSSDRQTRKALRGRKPMPPETVAKSMTGLAHHGLLKASHRYQLNQGSRGVVVSLPGDLVHDHFLELDKNRDGVIDPLERAVGRLDIERDMKSVAW